MKQWDKQINMDNQTYINHQPQQGSQISFNHQQYHQCNSYGIMLPERNQHTVDGRNPAITSCGKGSLSHSLQGFIHPLVVVWDF